MARRKTRDFHFRCDPDNHQLWQECADELDMSLASWIEAVCNREVLARRRTRLVSTIYPQKSVALPLE
jgi:hypothetical protein